MEAAARRFFTFKNAAGRRFHSHLHRGPDCDPGLAAIFAQVGAFALAPGSADCALYLTLAPGNYTAQVTSASGANQGMALIEVYDVAP